MIGDILKEHQIIREPGGLSTFLLLNNNIHRCLMRVGGSVHLSHVHEYPDGNQWRVDGPTFKMGILTVLINFCPFCGRDLHEEAKEKGLVRKPAAGSQE